MRDPYEPEYEPEPTAEEVEADIIDDAIISQGPPPNIVGVVEGTGEVFSPAETGVRKMPEKQLGKHRYAAIATFYLSPEQAEAAHTARNRVLLDPSNLIMYGIACVDCDTAYHQLRKTCPAKPSQWWS